MLLVWINVFNIYIVVKKFLGNPKKKISIIFFMPDPFFFFNRTDPGIRNRIKRKRNRNQENYTLGWNADVCVQSEGSKDQLGEHSPAAYIDPNPQPGNYIYKLHIMVLVLNGNSDYVVHLWLCLTKKYICDCSRS